jgi:hypothetical protein
MEQSRIEDPEINPCNYSYPILNKGTKNICWRRACLFNNWLLTIVETITRVKGKPIEWGKVFSSHSPDRGLMYRIY